MLKKIKDIVKAFFTESEEERIIREEREAKISKRTAVIESKTCPICGGKSFDKGYIHVSGESTVSGISTCHDDYNMRYDNLVHICSTCGYVLLFVDMNFQKKIMK